jgi:polyphosphate:AMP phosphotransferase
MFEVAEVGRTLDAAGYAAAERELRSDLLDLQQQLRTCPFPVVLVFAGVDAAGKSETANHLARWLDSRYVQVVAYDGATSEELERPEMWRYWRDLPKAGRIGVILSSWYSRPVLDRVYKDADESAFLLDLERIAGFERTLADSGALVVKFWMHLSKKAQKKRLSKLEKDPHQAWRVTPVTWENWKRYDHFVAAAEDVVRRTSAGHAPWHLIEGEDRRYREVEVARRVRDHLRHHLARWTTRPEVVRSPAPEPAERTRTVLDGVDLSPVLDKAMYREELEKHSARLAVLAREARRKGRSSILVFEGWDAAGKGGAIKRLTDVLDARDYRVHPIAAPTDDERRYPWLWRFWTRLERAGKVNIFDRSWYGRVLVERVEGFATEDEWRRAYAEIRQFEEQLVGSGAVVVKFWLHLSDQEQLARFQERADTPWKRWKLTDEDWRNRARRSAYEVAVDAMVERTSTRACPWTLVPAEHKYDARIHVIRTFADRLEHALLG